MDTDDFYSQIKRGGVSLIGTSNKKVIEYLKNNGFVENISNSVEPSENDKGDNE